MCYTGLMGPQASAAQQALAQQQQQQQQQTALGTSAVDTAFDGDDAFAWLDALDDEAVLGLEAPAHNASAGSASAASSQIKMEGEKPCR